MKGGPPGAAIVNAPKLHILKGHAPNTVSLSDLIGRTHPTFFNLTLSTPDWLNSLMGQRYTLEITQKTWPPNSHYICAYNG